MNLLLTKKRMDVLRGIANGRNIGRNPITTPLAQAGYIVIKNNDLAVITEKGQAEVDKRRKA